MISKFILCAAFNYSESHWFTSHQTWPDSTQKVYWHRHPSNDLILVHQTSLYYISYSSPVIHCVLCRLLGEICKPGEFDPSQNKLKCNVLAVLSSCGNPTAWRSHVVLTRLWEITWPHTHLHNGPLFPCSMKDPKRSVHFVKLLLRVALSWRGTAKLHGLENRNKYIFVLKRYALSLLQIPFQLFLLL